MASDPDTGKPYLIYGGKNEEEARQQGLEMLQGLNFEIRQFPTRNLAAASAMLRGVRLESGEGLHRSSERQGHERTLRRRRLRLSERNG